MNKPTDPLAVLISSDAKATDRAKLAELVGPYVAIDQDSKDFGFHPAFRDIDGNSTKIEILLAATKARALFFDMPDGLTSGEIIKAGIMAEGSAKTSLKRLFDSHRIKKDKEGRYLLPAHLIPEIIKKLAANS